VVFPTKSEEDEKEEAKLLTEKRVTGLDKRGNRHQGTTKGRSQDTASAGLVILPPVRLLDPIRCWRKKRKTDVHRGEEGGVVLPKA